MINVRESEELNCENKYYPCIIGSLLVIFRNKTNIKHFGVRIDGVSEQEYDKYLHQNYSADQYRINETWFEKNGTTIGFLINKEKDMVEKVFISSDYIDVVYELPSLFWDLFDESKDIRLLTKSIRYSVKKLYDPSPIEKLDESDKIKFDLIELIYKRLSGSFETHLEFEINLDEFGFFHVIPVFYFNTLLTEEYVSDKLVRTTSIVEFFDKYYQMEDTIRTINRLMEERNGK